jgi:hypothetical protein
MRVDWIGRVILVLLIIGVGIMLWAENSFSADYQRCVLNPFGGHVVQSTASDWLSRIKDIVGPQTICTIRLVDRHNGFFAVLTGLFVALFTFTLWRSTDKMWLAAKAQGEQTQASIREATRASNAMERVAGSLDINAQQIIETVKINRSIADTNKRNSESQQRAYLSVSTGNGLIQDRSVGTVFDARPTLKNTGWTPARKIRWSARAAILPVPLPDDHKFRLPGEMNGTFYLPPQQSIRLNAIVEGFADDAEVEDIMIGRGKSVYVWGLVTYYDVFGHFHRLTFNHQVSYHRDAENRAKYSVGGTWLHRHNVAS